jgi:hypothetical protein
MVGYKKYYSVDTTHAYHTVCHNRPVGCAVEFGSVIEESRLVTIEVERRSQTPSSLIIISVLGYLPTILMTFYHMQYYNYQLLGMWSRFHNYNIIKKLYRKMQILLTNIHGSL